MRLLLAAITLFALTTGAIAAPSEREISAATAYLRHTANASGYGAWITDAQLRSWAYGALLAAERVRPKARAR